MVNRIVVYPIPPWKTQITSVYRIRDSIVLNNREFNKTLVRGPSPQRLGCDVDVGQGSLVFHYGTRGRPNALNTRSLSCIRYRYRLKLFRTAREDISSVTGVLRPHQRSYRDGLISLLNHFGREKWKARFLERLKPDLVFCGGVLCPLPKKIHLEYRMIWKELYANYS